MPRRLGLFVASIVALGVGLAPIVALTPAANAVTAPRGLKTVARYPLGLKVAWGATAGATGYKLQWATAKDFSAGLHTKKTRSRSAYLAGLNDATHYYVRVQALKGRKHSAWSGTMTTATKVLEPAAIPTVTTTPGPNPGEVTVSWSVNASTASARQRLAATDYFTIDVAASVIGSDLSSVRGTRMVQVSRAARSAVIPAATLAAVGAGVGTGWRAFIRVSSWTAGNAGRGFANSPLKGEQPRGAHASGATPLIVASYNVDGGAGITPWSQRAPVVADNILNERTGVASMEELSQPQWNVLSPHLPGYAQIGVDTGNTIIYDMSRYSATSPGTMNAPASPYPFDPAVYALMRDKSTGATWWQVALHAPSGDTDASEQDRDAYVSSVIHQIDALKANHDVPVIVGGDFNSSQTWAPSARPSAFSAKPHADMVAAGFYDTASAWSLQNMTYASKNSSGGKIDAPRQEANPNGVASRIDQLWTLDATGSDFFKVVTANPQYGSDHNMVVAHVKLP